MKIKFRKNDPQKEYLQKCADEGRFTQSQLPEFRKFWKGLLAKYKSMLKHDFNNAMSYIHDEKRVWIYRHTSKGIKKNAETTKTYEKKNPDKVQEISARYRKENPEKVKKSQKTWRNSDEGKAYKKTTIETESKRSSKNRETLLGWIKYEWHSIKNRQKNLFNKGVTRRKFLGKFLTKVQFIKWAFLEYDKQKGLCFYCKKPVTFIYKRKQKRGEWGRDTNGSIDRAENHKDYTDTNNLRISCVKCNSDKNSSNLEIAIGQIRHVNPTLADFIEKELL
tara:strand:- start:52 stop:885 length:834 start_codon:yes stop_codon:yes gene_type:complete